MDGFFDGVSTATMVSTSSISNDDLFSFTIVSLSVSTSSSMFLLSPWLVQAYVASSSNCTKLVMIFLLSYHGAYNLCSLYYSKQKCILYVSIKFTSSNIRCICIYIKAKNIKMLHTWFSSSSRLLRCIFSLYALGRTLV